MKTTNIYVLIDPETKQVRYVGKANNVSQRRKAHLNRARKHQTHKKNWIESLRKKELKPILEVIDVVPIEQWQFWESYWICQMITWGFDLVNHTNGGDGCTFGNQTTFKKGNKSWNQGTANTKKCIVCGNDFKVSPSMASKRKTCSHKCGSMLKKQSTRTTQFKKEQIPWNKGLRYKHKK